MLLNKGADVNAQGGHYSNALQAASLIGHKETPLVTASYRGHLKVVKLLLEKGANIKIKDIDGWTPLNAASSKGHLEVVKLLLEKGADITVTNESGWTPLHTASFNGYVKLARLFLQARKNGHNQTTQLLLHRSGGMESEASGEDASSGDSVPEFASSLR
ncbi:multiple ankyrin repeats single KH domain (pfs domain-containing protein) [Colletotrichum tofieldiae]|uniref:Multiple ankyrin repeats single KH domain (Pfs domain-containing protein) n=1 Tax=Colletotrichum tofieldiae TaxID=708197 RepID=A0A161VNN6_9PEZI|nr:multiple ankyrin repeats single KH domain (pfs domain-containing protein) [Colletotrichum tofieldiae]